MVRDFDLIRRIMLDIQALPANSPATPISYPDEYDQAVVNEHMSLLIEAGLIHGKVLRTMSGIAQVVTRGLTWAGQDFVDAAKEESIWQKAKTFIKDKGGALTLEVLMEVLKRYALP